MNQHVKYLIKLNIGLLILFFPIFLIVMVILELIAAIIGLSYETVNVIVYYVIIPLSWFILLIIAGFKRNNKYAVMGGGLLTILYCYFPISILLKGNGGVMVQYLWDQSVSFLNSFGNQDVMYLIMSVLVCVNGVVMVYHFLSLQISDHYYLWITGKNRNRNKI